MLEVYKNLLTEKGRELHAKNLAGEKIEFTRFQLGNGTYTGQESAATLEKMLALKSGKDYFGVSKVEVANEATCRLSLIATNKDVKAAYYVTEVGVFAKGNDGKEILYSILVTKPDKPDWMPAYNSETPGSLKYYLYLSVGNAENVDIKIKAGGVASEEDLLALEERVKALEESSAAMVGIKRMCTEDGTPQSSTKWVRIGQATGATVEYARGNEEVENDLMKLWPYNKIRPCNLSMAGEPVAYLGEPDFDWYGKTGVAAGTSVMDEIPTNMYYSHFFTKDSSAQNWEYKIIAETDRYPNAVSVKDLMQRADGTKPDHFYFPCFLGYIDTNGHYVSVAGVIPTYNTSCTNYRKAVKTNGDNWQLIDVWAWEIFTVLLDIMSANSNARDTYGRGFSESGGTAYAALNTATGTNTVTVKQADATKFAVGQIVNIGNAIWNASIATNREITEIKTSTAVDGGIDIVVDGEAFNVTTEAMIWRGCQRTGSTVGMAAPNGTCGPNDGLHSNRCLWVEDFFGMLHTGVDGMNLKFNETDCALEMYVCTDPSKYGDTYDGYEKLDETLQLNRDDDANYDFSGYIKKEYYCKRYPMLSMPETINGGAGSNSYESAFCWKNKNGQRPFFGGAFADGAVASPRSRRCNFGFSYAYWNYGSRPLKR